MNIYESAEDYLERILILQEEKGKVRSIDIAKDMGFSKPSISVAMKKLKEAGLILIDEHGYITLTKEGHVIADRTYERHRVLKKVLIDIGVDPKIAEKDACKVEHVISEETFEAIKNHIEKVAGSRRLFSYILRIFCSRISEMFFCFPAIL